MNLRRRCGDTARPQVIETYMGDVELQLARVLSTTRGERAADMEELKARFSRMLKCAGRGHAPARTRARRQLLAWRESPRE